MDEQRRRNKDKPIMEQIIDRLKKIKTLADRGESGEAIAAKHQLDKLLENMMLVSSSLCVKNDQPENSRYKPDTNNYSIRYAYLLPVTRQKTCGIIKVKGQASMLI